MANASAAPTAMPQAAIVARWRRASANAGRTRGGRSGWATANANAAFSRKLVTVKAMMARPIGMRIGPRSTWNDLPCRTWALRSNIASQIHIAGRIWTSIRRQLVTISRRPSNSSTKALTANASGAKYRRRRLSRRMAASIFASSFDWIAVTSDPIRAPSEPKLVIPTSGYGAHAAGLGSFALSAAALSASSCARSSRFSRSNTATRRRSATRSAANLRSALAICSEETYFTAR